ncbi:MAG: hypothetical protein DRH26_06155 [Deltaproteobacteria bacterium]|nr:MAG: hypothetical protein DRH26_06155 [Deltaproteobacteria bacterium]
MISKELNHPVKSGNVFNFEEEERVTSFQYHPFAASKFIANSLKNRFKRYLWLESLKLRNLLQRKSDGFVTIFARTGLRWI